MGEEHLRRGARGFREADRRPARGFAGRRGVRRVLPADSAVYLVNDLVDIEKDREHPTKRHRPIASGKLKPQFARALAGLFAVAALGSGLALGWGFALTAAGYLALNAAYSFRLKRIAFVDVACMSVGFLLRVLAGAFAIDVPPSRWLLVCTLLLSALLGFGKRAHELRIGGEGGHKHREVLGDYNPEVLRVLLWVLGIATMLAYLAYTRTQHTNELFGGGNWCSRFRSRPSASTASSASLTGPTPPTAPPIRCSAIRRSS